MIQEASPALTLSSETSTNLGLASNPPLAFACLVVLVGPPGSGKSTWVSRNGRGAVHVSQDGLIDAITPEGFEHTYRPIYRAAEDAVARAALETGFTVLVDRTNRTREHRKRWLRIAEEAGCPAVAVVMTASAPVCRVRNRMREARRRLSESRMERMLAAHEAVCRDEGFAAIFESEHTTLREIITVLRSMRKETSDEHRNETRR
ncbi:MAG: hypothetical protein C5B51_20865 [Terriglobia bacterium]|nr:MAG: hypothetical protein C5B51_20865 [Terriglobia bacterium]